MPVDALLQPGQVRLADPRQPCQLVPPQPRDPAPPGQRHVALRGRDPGRPGLQELSQQQDPQVTAAVILELVDAEEPPLRLFLGAYPYPVVEAAYQKRLETWDAWRNLATKA
jgi:hypothetical protein